ncbi:fatty acid elongase [Basidiobolus meristosporus CBS 931.73]|uniref:Elongation of fatty acids protein n=1 Tax=Basidiobolus meristosporus CBS 931.73 TaxID=1314790 RepID=A0A1Y1Z908_9FUNG|nr:fatty acid elongase [Basidiobolus meristosporus CBS 931.73]|eukprot:ORY06594.1 fatty acid elongase [Basidiobolus meristosporus CBS 931.73]
MSNSEEFPLGQYYDFFMYWKTPVITALVYVLVISALNPQTSGVSRVVAKSGKQPHKAPAKKSSRLFTAFIVFHNLVLCLFSGITFYNMGGAWLQNFRSRNFMDAFCDRGGKVWESDLQYWGWLFYLSKYYEIIDTIIILAKGRRSSFLQTFHHAGAIITMWYGTLHSATPIWIFVVFNSFIHTIMYFYYILTCLGYSPPGKKYLTSMQITQFVIGISLALSYLFVDDCLTSDEGRWAVYLNASYVIPLTFLFKDFAKRTYGKKSKVV